MVHLYKQFTTGKRMAGAGVMAIAMLLGVVVATLPTSSAAALNCRVFTSTQAGTEAGMSYSKKYWVPKAGEQGCKDINVRNIKNLQVAGDYCATFKVQFFPTWGSPYYGASKKVCSQGANGPIVPLATKVLDGTEYRIWHNLENENWKHTYQIID